MRAAILCLATGAGAFVFPSVPNVVPTLSAKPRGEGYGHLLDDITETVGNTPVVKISSKTCPPGRTIYAKCEFFNPLSSAKDRLALAVIEEAERAGASCTLTFWRFHVRYKRITTFSNAARSTGVCFSSGRLKPGDTVVEATSGNTGVAVAMMCAQRGYKCVITMAESFSIERRKIMRMLGAKVRSKDSPVIPLFCRSACNPPPFLALCFAYR